MATAFSPWRLRPDWYVEYKYGVNAFADQEQLVDDMVDGAHVRPSRTFRYANRQMAAGSTANDVFGHALRVTTMVAARIQLTQWR